VLLAFIGAQLVRSFPSLKWLWISVMGVFWIFASDLGRRLWSWSFPSGQHKAPQASDEDLTLCLEKSWSGLHFLLTGTAFEGEEPFCYLIVGGQDVGRVPGGPVRLLSAEQVRQFRDALRQITPDQLRSRYDPEEMKRLEIYPNTWLERDELRWLIDDFGRLHSFIAANAENENAVIVWLD
jgi:hypothetical protein